MVYLFLKVDITSPMDPMPQHKFSSRDVFLLEITDIYHYKYLQYDVYNHLSYKYIYLHQFYNLPRIQHVH